MDKEIEERVTRAIQEKVFPGCVIGISVGGKRGVQAFGTFTYESDPPKVAEDTVYDVASVTKSIPTASLAAMYLSEGKLSLVDTVKTYIPELQNDFGATIEDLLRYRVAGVRMSTLAHMSSSEITARIFEKGFNGPAGDAKYTNLPAFLLGLILERIAGVFLGALADKRFFQPLGMHRTMFLPSDERLRKSFIVPTEEDVEGIAHDESARVFTREGKAVGHAGLFSTAPDLLAFLEALLQGEYPNILEGAQKGLGWQLNDTNFMGQYTSPKTFGKTGFTGTSVLGDVERGIAFVILSNRTYPKRPETQDAIFAFRRDIADIVLK